MTSSRSSSHERAKARMRVEANHKRGVGRGSRNVDESSCSSSEEESSESGSRDLRRNGGKEYGRPSNRERRSSSSYDRSRRRKRSSSPSPTRKKKIRSTSDSDSPHPRSRSSNRHSHSHRKYSSFHKRYWHRSGGSRNGNCCCVPYYSEKENRICYKRKGIRSRSPGRKRAEAGKHHHSRSRESINYGPKCKIHQTPKFRRQTSRDVNYFQENTCLLTESDSPRRGNHSGNSAPFVKAEEESQSDYGSPPTEKGRHFSLSLQHADTDVKETLRSNGRSTQEHCDRLGHSLGRVRRKYGEDQLLKPGTLGTVGKSSSDWLDLSLKAPAKPTPRIEGISREDLRLCLDSSLPSAATVSGSVGDGKLGAERADENDEKAPSTSSCKEDFEASLCSTSHFSVQAGLPVCNGSRSVRSNALDVACPGNTTLQEEATSSLNNFKTSPALNQDRDRGTLGSALVHENKIKEESCFNPPNQRISASEDKDEIVADPDIPADVSLKEQLGVLAVSSEEDTANGISSPTGADISVSVIELSNSLSTEQNDGERSEVSGDNKEVNSVDRFMSVKEKGKVATTQDTAATQVEPSTLPEAPSLSKSMKSNPALASSCLLVELSDSTTLEEDDDEHASEIQSQPALPSAVSQLNETSDKFEPLPKLNMKDRPLVRSSCSRDSSAGRASLRITPAVQTGSETVQYFSDLDHATDLFIEKVHSLLNHAGPHSPRLASRLKFSSSLKERLAEDPGSTHMIRREDPSSSRRGSIEVVELSDSSSESSSSGDESDDSEIELDVSTKRCNQICQRKFKTVETPEKTQVEPEIVSDHPMQYLNEDVVCCSNKPSLKRGRITYGEDQQSRVSYMRDKHGNLIQVVDVDDSDAEGDCDELDTKSCEGDKEDEFFSSHPLVLPVIEEIKEMLQCENSSVEKSSEMEDQSEPSSSAAVKVRPSSRTGISSHTSQRKKSRKLVLEESDSQESDAEREAAVGRTSQVTTGGAKLREKWKRGIVCDLCSLGPSLGLGEWCCWCCGMAATSCKCPEEKKLRKQLSLGYRKGQKLKKRGKQILRYQWSGKVHKMCALWSSEIGRCVIFHRVHYNDLLQVYVKQSLKKEPCFAQLEAAVKRGNTLVCKHPNCKKTGATLGCRVRACRRSYHYPCAEKLANQCMVRMWDGVLIPIACQYHRHVEEQAERARERLLRSKITDPVRDGKTVVPAERPYIGKKLLCEDIAQGLEQVQIPCTNDVDDEPAPIIRYITKCWFKGRPVDHLHPVGTELAKGCQGCAGYNFDNPHSFMPLHVIGADKTDRSRESDDRLDWQGEHMYGRLPYNSAGLLQLGPDSKDIVECNSRCKCGPKCKNRELQKGLRCHLELFKTKDRGWGVRALEQIPRGKFVVEYVGDVLTQAEADERGEMYDQNQLSYLFNLDHPGVPHSDAIVLDGITMSNIARFINHSCEGNLMIFRVFSETNDLRYFRIGMYAIQDIEVGDELSYDYNYALSKDSSEMVDDPTAIRCFCGTPTCRKWLWQGGDSGLKH